MMKKASRRHLITFAAMLLVVVTLVPVNAFAATKEEIMPLGSDYLDSYSAYVYPAGSGKIQVWYIVDADTYMDDIGALRIMLYESSDNTNWSWKKTYTHDVYTSMMGHDKIAYSSHVDYDDAVAGYYYKAYVTIWAGVDGGGDTRYMWTSVKQAT